MRRFVLLVALTIVATVVHAQQAGDQRVCLTGQVVGDNDKGVGGAGLKLVREGTTAVIPVSTDSAGRFVFTNCSAGWYSLSVLHPDYPQLVYGAPEAGGLGTPLVLGGEPLIGLTVRLVSAAVVSGTVRKVSGDPLGGVQISVEGLGIDSNGVVVRSGAGSGLTSASDAHGQYRVPALPPGRYLVRASPPRAPISGTDPPEGFVSTYYPAALRAEQGTWIDLESNQTLSGIDVLIQTARYVEISGRALDAAGTPVGAGRVSIEDADGRALLVTGSLNTGRFSIPSVPAGQYLIRLAEGSATDRPVRAFTFANVTGASSPVEVELVVPQSSSVKGTLAIRGADGRAPSAFRVTLIPRDPRLRGAAFGVPVKADGSFSIDGIPPGEHRLSITGASPAAGGAYRLVSARVGDQETADGFFQVGSGATLNATLIASEVTGQITGTVSHSNGAPATEYTVVVFPTNKAQWPAWNRRSFGARPANTGEFHVQNVPAGDYRVAVVEKARRNEWLLPEFLESLIGSSTSVSVMDNVPTNAIKLVVK